jgi:transcription factor SPN1
VFVASQESNSILTRITGRRKAFSRKLDEALKKPKTNNRRKAGIDLEQMADSELEEMRRRMAEAAQADTQARDEGKPAMHKLKLLPEVVALLNRNTLQNALVDPDINLLESVRFFLEPLNDGSLPAYNIQRELFACLAKLPISKDALVASGIGKVTHFYTRSTKAEPGIRRQAEKLVGEWTRPILKRTDDFRKREFVEATYDPSQQPMRSTQTVDKVARAAAARKAALAYPTVTNRARVDGGLGTYTIVPKSDLTRAQPGVRRLGAAGDELARKLQARSKNQRR